MCSLGIEPTTFALILLDSFYYHNYEWRSMTESDLRPVFKKLCSIFLSRLNKIWSII